MWIEKFSIKNIKCFKDLPELLFTREGQEPYRWVTLLGENGTGKSTLLKSMALLLAGPQSAKKLYPYSPDGWLNQPDHRGEISMTLRQDVTLPGVEFATGAQKHQIDENEFRQSNGRIFRSLPFAYYVVDKNIEVNKVRYGGPDLVEHPSSWLNWLQNNALREESQGWFAAGYGSFRRVPNRKQMSAGSKPAQNRMSNFITQFDEKMELTTLDQWIGNQVLLSTGTRSEVRDQARVTLARIAATIPHFLPRFSEVPGQEQLIEMGYLDPETNERVVLDDSGEVIWQLNNGLMVSSSSLSDGYRSILAFTGDLVARLALAFPHLADPTQAPGVVLVDELDAHLHPSWQRQIAKWLQDKFPNIQFIVATHSPFIAVGAGENALTLRFKRQAGEVICEQVSDLALMDVDDVLHSPAFELISTHSPQVQKDIQEYYLARQELKQFAEGSPEYIARKEKMNVLQERVAIAQNYFVEPGSLDEKIENYIKTERE